MIGCKDLVGELLKEVPYPLGSPVICFFYKQQFYLKPPVTVHTWFF